MKATVAERGQVTIPKAIREQLGIKSGTTLEFREEAGKLVATKVPSSDPVERVYGCLGKGLVTDKIMAALRGGR